MSTKSDSEDFEDAIDTLTITTPSNNVQNLLLHHPLSIPPPLEPPPPLPEHLTTSPDPDHELPPSLPISPISSLPPPLPPRRILLSKNSTLKSSAIEHEIITTKTPDQQLYYGRQRGHAKSNSLDRGLSLAKCLKTGPFPPPSASKSNSLTRGASPNGVLKILDDQDQTAQGVIQVVIQQVLSEKTPSTDGVEVDHIMNINLPMNHLSSIEENCTVENIKITEKILEPQNVCKNPSIPHYENLIQSSHRHFSQPTNINVRDNLYSAEQHQHIFESNKKQISEKQHRRSASDKSPGKLKSSTSEQQKSSTWEINQKNIFHQQQLDSMDPITRDVERRMSLKEKTASSILAVTRQNDADINDAASSSDDVFGQKHTSLEHVRRFAKTYGIAASDFMRGTIQKVRLQAANLTKNTNKSNRKTTTEIVGDNDMDGASSIADSEDVSVAMSISVPPIFIQSERKIRAINSAEPPSTARTAAFTNICRPKNAKKGPFDFDSLRLVQELHNEHSGSIWCIKFSDCGRLLATAGQDALVRVWILKSQLEYFTALREQYGKEVNMDYSTMHHFGDMRADLYERVEEEERLTDPVDSAPEQPIETRETGRDSATNNANIKHKKGDSTTRPQSSTSSFASSSRSHPYSESFTRAQVNGPLTNASSNSNIISVFSAKPFCIFRGHTADVLDLAWSPRNYFLLSGGMDRTVKLWHLTRSECLCSFQHVDFVTSIAFMPKDDRYFISGSLDGKIRLWHIPEKRVAIWNEVEDVVKFVTAITFVKNGKFVVVGTYNGRCFFYSTDQLKYHTVIDIQSSKRNKDSKGPKITSLAINGDKLLVASNDSRIRIYDLRDMDLCCKFKGAQLEQSQIRAAFSPDGKYIISGSEDSYVYLWRTSGLPASLTVRKDRNHAWERIRAHQTVVTTAVFAPKPQLILSWLMDQQKQKMQSLAPESMPISLTPKKSPRNSINEPVLNGTNRKLRYFSSSAERPFLALASRLALPTANLTDIQLRRSKLSTSSLDYSMNSILTGCNAFSSASLGTSEQHFTNSRDRCTLGDVIVSADLSGQIKVFINSSGFQTGASSFFPF